MLEKLKQRLAELKAEYSTGQMQLATLEQQADALRETLLRVAGAIQVIEEELAGAEAS
ncbi:MAG: hypothetical protein KDD04_04640 [Sinomicrobium sp.]|nr:hypothetical protein [Sinomicrobium sp.]